MGIVAIVWLIASAISSIVVVGHLIVEGGQRMWIMDIVWPITALWAGPIGAWAYYRFGRAANKRAKVPKDDRSPVTTAKATTHCGAGCALGDVVAAFVAVAAPLVIAGHEIFGEWVYALIAAFGFGIAFQYFTIKPMRGLSRRDGIIAALKADSLSLAAWQVGMYGWMAITRFAIFGHRLDKTSSVFWVMMQIAMFIGFATSYPVNAWLLRHGLKERM